MTAAATGSFDGRDLELELIDPGSAPLVRLFRHKGGDWDPPPEANRNLRVDPPIGHKGAFAVLYTATRWPPWRSSAACSARMRRTATPGRLVGFVGNASGRTTPAKTKSLERSLSAVQRSLDSQIVERQVVFAGEVRPARSNVSHQSFADIRRATVGSVAVADPRFTEVSRCRGARWRDERDRRSARPQASAAAPCVARCRSVVPATSQPP